MVAVESIPMNLIIFPKFWVNLLDNDCEAAVTFINQLCTNCNNFRDFLLLILTEERDWLSDDHVFQLFDQLSLKVSFFSFGSFVASNNLWQVNGLSRTNQTNLTARDTLSTMNSMIEKQPEPDLRVILTVCYNDWKQ